MRTHLGFLLVMSMAAETSALKYRSSAALASLGPGTKHGGFLPLSVSNPGAWAEKNAAVPAGSGLPPLPSAIPRESAQPAPPGALFTALFLCAVAGLAFCNGLKWLHRRISMKAVIFESTDPEQGGPSTEEPQPVVSSDLFRIAWQLNAESRAVLMIFATVLVFELHLASLQTALLTNCVIAIAALICTTAQRMYSRAVKPDSFSRSVLAGFLYYGLCALFWKVATPLVALFAFTYDGGNRGIIAVISLAAAFFFVAFVEESCRYLLVKRAFVLESARTSDELLLHAVAASAAFGAAKAVFCPMNFWDLEKETPVKELAGDFMKSISTLVLHVSLGVVIGAGVARFKLTSAIPGSSVYMHALWPAVLLRGIWSFAEIFYMRSAVAMYDTAVDVCNLTTPPDDDVLGKCLSTPKPELELPLQLFEAANVVFWACTILLPILSAIVARLQLYSLRYEESRMRKPIPGSETETLLATLLASRGWTLAPPSNEKSTGDDDALPVIEDAGDEHGYYVRYKL